MVALILIFFQQSRYLLYNQDDKEIKKTNCIMDQDVEIIGRPL